MPYLAGFITPQDYGAAGNGTADDTIPIQNALNAAPLGGLVYLPPGTYGITSPLTIPPQVSLWGSHSSHIDSTTCEIKALAGFSSTNAAMILLVDQTTGGYSVPSNQQGLYYLTLDGSAITGSTTDGVQAQGFVHGVIIQDVQIRSVPNHGIFSVSNGSGFAYSWRGTRLVVQACGGYGYAVGGMTDSTWFDCEALGCQKSGWLLATQPSNSKLVSCRSEFSNFNGFEFSGAWTGGSASGGCTLVDCSTDGNNRNGVFVTATGDSPLSIIGGYYRRDGANGTSGGGNYAGIQVTGGTIPVRIVNPTIFPGIANSGGANSPQIGVAVNSSSANVTIDGGVLHAATTAWSDDGTNTNLCYGANILERVGTEASYTSTTTGLQTARNSIYLGNAATVPAANPSGGALLYTRNGGLITRDPNGGIFPLVAGPETAATTGALAETVPRTQVSASSAFTSGNLLIQSIFLPAGVSVGHIGFGTGTTAGATMTHWWAALLDNTYKQQAHSADQTSGAIAASTWFSLAMATPFVTTYSGTYFLALMVAATTMPTILQSGVTPDAQFWTGTGHPTPVPNGVSSTGLTTPGTDGTTTYTAPSAASAPYYMYAAV